MKDGFIKAAAATPEIKVANCAHNAQAIITQIERAAQKGASLISFPELCITGYTCADLFLQRTLLDDAERALAEIACKTASLDIVSVVGLPVRGCRLSRGNHGACTEEEHSGIFRVL